MSQLIVYADDTELITGREKKINKLFKKIETVA